MWTTGMLLNLSDLSGWLMGAFQARCTVVSTLMLFLALSHSSIDAKQSWRRNGMFDYITSYLNELIQGRR